LKQQFTKQFNIYYFINIYLFITESSAYISLKISKQQRAQSTNAAQHQHSMQHLALACMNHDARCTKLPELFTALHTHNTTTQFTQVTLLTNSTKQAT
jgi:hypothetical protein